MGLREQFLTEVEGGAEVELKVGIVGSAVQNLLRVVQRKRPNVVGARLIGTDHNALRLFFGTANHSVAVYEKRCRVEVRRIYIRLVGFFQPFDAVERIDGGAVVLVIIGQEIPALLEDFDGIGLDVDGIADSLTELSVGHSQLVALFHGVDDKGQIFFSGRYVLQHDAVFQRTAFHEHITDGQGVEQPMLKIIVRKDIFVCYIIKVSSLALALDGYVEHFFDGLSVAIEGDAVHGDAAAHICLYPSFVQILESNVSETTDGIDNPYVLFEDAGWFHGLKLLGRCKLMDFLRFFQEKSKISQTCNDFCIMLRRTLHHQTSINPIKSNKNMEKQMEMKEMKSVDMQCVVAGTAVLFCVLAAIFGYESLSIGGVIIFALVCVMGCMLKDWAEFCRELVEED